MLGVSQYGSSWFPLCLDKRLNLYYDKGELSTHLEVEDVRTGPHVNDVVPEQWKVQERVETSRLEATCSDVALDRYAQADTSERTS